MSITNQLNTLSISKKIINKYQIQILGRIQIFNVDYLHIKLDDESDLYLTKYGMSCYEQLLPINHVKDREWFTGNSKKLPGSSSVFKIKTKPGQNKSKDIVLKWNRMGEPIPGADCEEHQELAHAEFNSPFEEFALLFELRNSKFESPGRILTQKPLAIYVPVEKNDLSSMERKEYKLNKLLKTHQEIELDIYRSYAVIFDWLKGIDSTEAYRKDLLEEKNVLDLTISVDKQLEKKGFIVRDRKPHHIIIRPDKNNDFVRDKNGELLFGLIDYELLEKTPDKENSDKKKKRIEYLNRQKDRFITDNIIPEHLKEVNIFDVDYIYGHTESTGGRLWVVGKDPDLFDYFLPERWETTQKTKLSATHEIYHTVTKDNINLVWKVSKVGIMPDMDPFKPEEKKILEYGFNSPFEEVSIAIELSRKGIRTIYPRAIYMANKKTDLSENLRDNRRFKSHENIKTPDGQSILLEDYTYISLWGYWNGPDEKLASKDADYYKAIDALRAYHEKIVTEEEYLHIVNNKNRRLLKIGFEDLHFRGRHILLSMDKEGKLILDKQNLPDERICNYELLKRV